MRAAIYIRVSTLDQAREGYSLPAQEATLREKAAGLGYEVADVYCDAGISAKDITHRPALVRLMGDVRKDKIDVVMVWALSRLTRSVAEPVRHARAFRPAPDVSLQPHGELRHIFTDRVRDGRHTSVITPITASSTAALTSR